MPLPQINSGDLRHRISIQSTTTVVAASGQRNKTWATFYRCWARIKPVMGREAEFAKTFAATVSHQLTIRWVAGILPTHRVLYDGRHFSINAILDPEERRKWLYLYCTEEVNPTPTA